MNGFALLLGMAMLLGFIKGITYFGVFALVGGPTLGGGRKLDRAFVGAVARALLGVVSTVGLLFFFQPYSEANQAPWMLTAIHQGVRLLLWLAAILIVYHSATFKSKAHRWTFIVGVLILGSLVNWMWDQWLFEGTPLKSVNSKWC